MKVKGKFYYLLFSLLLLLIVYPIVGKHISADRMLVLFFSLILLSGIRAVMGQRTVKVIIGLILVLPAIVLIWADQFFVNRDVHITARLFLVVFSFFTVGCIVSFLMKAKRVNGDMLSGAASAYLLIGISWSILYDLLENVAPGSLAFSDKIGADMVTMWPLFNYYSFVTLTTIGYGDITPITLQAQSLSILEAVTGVLFIALLISRLVGMHLYQMNNMEDPNCLER
jgi:hypothetical protein